MRKDPTEFRERFAKWKAGEKVYENGLPKYGDGTTNVIPEDLQGLSDPQFQPQIDAAKVQMTPFVVDDTAYRAQKYHPGVTREQVQELYNNTPYIGSSQRFPLMPKSSCRAPPIWTAFLPLRLAWAASGNPQAPQPIRAMS